MDGCCVVFDFDGTILDTEEPVYRSWAELWSEHGHELDLVAWQQIIGTAEAFDPWVELERRLGRPLDPALRERRRDRRDELQARHGPREGVLDWMVDAERRGLALAVASSSPPEWVTGHLERLGLRHRFAAVVGRSARVPPKPDPTSYREACRLLAAEPSRSVAVEDSPHGVAAAIGARLFTVAVPHPLTAGLDLSAADVVLGALSELSLGQVLGLMSTATRW